MTQRLFLSTVTSDFGPLRDFLAEQLRPSGFHVVHQREFIETGRNTLVKLAEFIESESDIVLHCLGPSTGSVPPTEYTDELLRQCGEELHQRFRSLFEDDAFRRLTYTQWEAWLGKFYGKLVLPYQSAAAAAVPIQHDNTPMSNGEHLERLKPLAGYPTPFTGNADLLDQVKTALLRQRTGGAASVRLPNNLPYPTLGTLFKGREPFLKAVQEKFQSGANVVGVMTPVAAQAVHGLGGVGKTRAAVEYAWRHETEFTALLFVTADSPENLQRQLASLVGPLVLNIPEAQLVTNQEAQVAAAIHWLQEHPRWCLILDNVDTEPAAVAVQQLLTQLTRGRVLITSRLSKWSGGVEKLELDVLEPQDACDYLLEKTSGERESAPDDETQARAIANDLDHLILGLEQAAAYITALGLSLGGYRQRWESKRMEILGYLDPIEMTYPNSLAVTWETSFAQLSSEGQLLLEHLAWFAPEPVPMFLFDDQKPSTVWNELLGGDARLALANLKRYSLAKPQPTAPGATILVHRLVQEITRGRIAVPERVTRISGALRVLDAGDTGHPEDVRTWTHWEPLASHYVAATTFADQAGIADPTARLMNNIAQLYNAKALYSQAEPLMRRALAIAEQFSGAEHPDVARDLNNLAQLLQATNRLAEAEPLLRRALEIDEQSSGPDHPDVARDLNNLAHLLQATNRRTEAEPLMRRALAIDEQSSGAEHPKVAIRLNNLAQLLQATNRRTEAEPLLRRALAIFVSSLGADHPSSQTAARNYRVLKAEMA